MPAEHHAFRRAPTRCLLEQLHAFSTAALWLWAIQTQPRFRTMHHTQSTFYSSPLQATMKTRAKASNSICSMLRDRDNCLSRQPPPPPHQPAMATRMPSMHLYSLHSPLHLRHAAQCLVVQQRVRLQLISCLFHK